MDQVPSNYVMWTGLVAFLLPPVLSIVMQQGWSAQAKSVVAFVACVVAAVGLAFWQGNLDGRDVAASALVIVTVAQATYQGFWRPSGISGAVESRTTLR